MFFRPTPSKFDQAKQAALDAANAARETASNVADSAHSLLEHAPQIASNVAETVTHRASEVAGVVTHKAAEVGEVVSSKVEAVRHRSDDTAEAAQNSVEAAQVKAAATRKAAEVAAKEAERAARDAQKKAEAEIARVEKDLARKRAEYEEQQEYIAERATQLETARLASQQQAEEIHTRRKAPVTVEVHTPDDHGFEYHVVDEYEGDKGSKLWLIIGGAIVIGAALVYFFAPGSGRRSRAAIKDRLGKVKDDAVDKVTSAADAASKKGSEITERAADLGHRAEDKLAEVAGAASDKVEEVKDKTELAVETHEDAVPGESGTPAELEKPITDEELADEIRAASQDAVDGVAVEAYAPLDQIETAATAGSELDGPRNPNIFDKVSQMVGHAAEAAENLAGEHKDDTATEDKSTGEETDSTSASDQTTESAPTSPAKKKKGK